jgi:SAM-dependent methyltransferase
VITSRDGATFARYYDLDLAIDPGETGPAGGPADFDLAAGPADLDLYLALAVRAGGPILELAAGTGRLAVPLAAAGHEVVAVDRDTGMLDRAAAAWDKVERAGHVERGGSLELSLGDLFGLDRGGRFGLVILAINTLHMLGDSSRQAAAVGIMARHLRTGGLAVVDAWLPGPDELAAFDGRVSLEWLRDDPETGERVAKLMSATHDAAHRRVELTTIFDATPPGGGPVIRHLRQDVLHLTSVDELRRAASDAGLAEDALGSDYELTPFGPGAERAVLVARLV